MRFRGLVARPYGNEAWQRAVLDVTVVSAWARDWIGLMDLMFPHLHHLEET